MEKPSPISLQDALNYQPEQYLSEAEIEWIRTTFGNNPKGVQTLRKILLPTVEDPGLPLEEFGKDTFGAGYNFSSMPEENIKSIVVARQDAIKMVIGGLIHLKVIANLQEPSRQQLREAHRKNSAQ